MIRKDIIGIGFIAVIALLFVINGWFLFHDSDPYQSFQNPDEPNTITFITEINPPFAYLDANGMIKGSSIEMLKILANMSNSSYSLEQLPWYSGYGRALSNPNTAIFPVAWTPERKNLFKWVGPTDFMNYAFFSRSDNPIVIRTDEDLHNAGTIGVVRNSARHLILQERKFTNIMVYDTDTECIAALQSGDVDMWLGSINMYSQDRKSLGDQLNRISMIYPYDSVKLFIAFNIDTPDELVKSWEDSLLKIQSEDLKKIYTLDLPFYCSWIDCEPCDYSDYSAEFKPFNNIT